MNYHYFQNLLETILTESKADAIVKELKIKNATDETKEMIEYGYNNATNDSNGQPINRKRNDFLLGYYYKGYENASVKNNAYNTKQAKKNLNTIKIRLNKELR